jgi:hypothetical protein
MGNLKLSRLFAVFGASVCIFFATEGAGAQGNARVKKLQALQAAIAYLQKSHDNAANSPADTEFFNGILSLKFRDLAGNKAALLARASVLEGQRLSVQRTHGGDALAVQGAVAYAANLVNTVKKMNQQEKQQVEEIIRGVRVDLEKGAYTAGVFNYSYAPDNKFDATVKDAKTILQVVTAETEPSVADALNAVAGSLYLPFLEMQRVFKDNDAVEIPARYNPETKQMEENYRIGNPIRSFIGATVILKESLLSGAMIKEAKKLEVPGDLSNVANQLLIIVEFLPRHQASVNIDTNLADYKETAVTIPKDKVKEWLANAAKAYLLAKLEAELR